MLGCAAVMLHHHLDVAQLSSPCFWSRACHVEVLDPLPVLVLHAAPLALLAILPDSHFPLMCHVLWGFPTIFLAVGVFT